MSLQQDILQFKKLLYSGDKFLKGDSIVFFNRFYAFSNECIEDYLSQIDINGKNVLTAGSSGDQVLYSLLYGAKDVTCFDINPFSKYVFDLKEAFIKTFNYNQMHDMFINSYLSTCSLFEKDNYQQVRHELSPDSLMFWDSAFAAGLCPATADWVYQGGITCCENCAYLKDENLYNRLQQRLIANNYSTKFICCDLRQIFDHIGSAKFDLILLSNIFDYTPKWEEPEIADDFGKPGHLAADWKAYKPENYKYSDMMIYNYGYQKFKAIVKGLAKYNLSAGGLIQVGYEFDNCSVAGEHLKYLFGSQYVTPYRAKEAFATIYAPQLKVEMQASNVNKKLANTDDNAPEPGI